MNILQQSVHGIKCDNPECNYKDLDLKIDDYSVWIDKPCPKCGENLLTQDDYENLLALQATVNVMNQMTAEQLSELIQSIDPEILKDNPMFKGAKGLEHLMSNENLNVSLDLHNGIKVTEINISDPPDKPDAE